MALEIIGRLDRKMPVQSGVSQRGEWMKREFILTTEDTYPKNICMNVWGKDKVEELEKYPDGSRVKASVNIESREFNGRWYTDVRAWKIEMAGDMGTAPAASQPTPISNIMGGNAQPAQPAAADIPFESDDLPF